MARLGRGTPKRPQVLRLAPRFAAQQFFAALTGTAVLSATLANSMEASLTSSATVTAALLTDRVVVKETANITGSMGSQATTALLPAPSGKTTADFSPGTIQDDTRLSGNIDIGQEGYTELEWSLATTSLIAGGDVIEFRLVTWPDDGELAQYLTLPTWTVGTADTTLAAAFTAGATVAADLAAPEPVRPKGVLAPTLRLAVDRAAKVRVARPNPLQQLSASPEDDIGLKMAAGLLATGTVNASLTSAIRMAGALSATGQLDASLTTSVTLAGALSGTATLVAPLQIGGEIAAALSGTATLAADLTTGIGLAADLSGLAYGSTLAQGTFANTAATLVHNSTATGSGLGLWVDEDPTTPWVYTGTRARLGNVFGQYPVRSSGFSNAYDGTPVEVYADFWRGSVTGQYAAIHLFRSAIQSLYLELTGDEDGVGTLSVNVIHDGNYAGQVVDSSVPWDGGAGIRVGFQFVNGVVTAFREPVGGGARTTASPVDLVALQAANFAGEHFGEWGTQVAFEGGRGELDPGGLLEIDNLTITELIPGGGRGYFRASLQSSSTELVASLPATATLAADLTASGATMAAGILSTAGLTAELETSGAAMAAALTGTATILADLTAPIAVPDHPVTVTGMARAAVAWRENSGIRWLGIGTHSNLQVFAGGVLHDITPTGLVLGRPNAQMTSGAYGQGAYGVGAYGVGDLSQSQLDEATVWSLDTFGQFLVGVSPEDGRIVVWDNIPSNPAQPLNTDPFPGLTDGGHPTSALAVVVTPERFLMVLGADGDPRRVQWADMESLTVWNPTAINAAGDFPLQTTGTLRAGRASKDETLLWTDTDLWAARYIGGQLVYAFERVGTACGVVSRGAMAVVDGSALWMGLTGFYRYTGYVTPLPCDVVDMVFKDFNHTQASKVTCHTIAQYNEVWWHYPSAGSLENDRYVAVNITDGTWMAGALGRTCGVDRGTLPNPVLIGADGICYEHEKGNDRGALVPYAETGFIELADGDVMSLIRRLIPDEANLGDVDVVITTRDWPNGRTRTYGPYDLSAPTNLRITGREIQIRVQEREPSDWRVGDIRLDLVPRGKR